MAVATITLVLVTGVDSTLGLEPAIFIASGALAALPAGAALGPKLVGFTDLLAGRLLGASPALLGGAAYSEWGVVAVAVGATLAVVVPGALIVLRVGALAPVAGLSRPLVEPLLLESSAGGRQVRPLSAR